MQALVEGQRMRGPNGEDGIVQNGHIVILNAPAPNSITTRPGDPTLPTRQAILAEDLRRSRMQNRQLSDQLGPEQSAAASNLAGEDYLATLPPADQRMVRALAEGRMQIPGGRTLTNAQWQRWLQEAQQFDPTLDAANARTRYMTRREYTSGVTSRNVQALNTALGHLDSLAESAGALDNFSWIPLVNSLANRGLNAYREASGDPRVTRFNLDRQAVADEMEKVFRGTGGSLEGVRGWQARISTAQSPEQLNAAISEAADLLNSRLHAVADSYDRAMGRSDAHMEWLAPHARETMARYGFSEWGSGGEQPAAGPAGPTVGIEGTTATRNPGTTSPAPGVDRTATAAFTPSGTESRQLNAGADLEIDPVLRTVGRHLGNMIASGRPDNEVLQYAREAGVDPHGSNLPNVLRWRRGERVPGFNGTFRQWRGQNPHSAYPLGESFYTRDVPQTATRRVLSSIAESPYGAATTSFGNALAGNRLDDIVGLTGGNAEQARAGMQALRDQNPGSSLIGDVAGTAAAYAGGNSVLRRLGATAAARFVPQAIRGLGTAGRARLGDAAMGLYQGTGDDYGNAPLSMALNTGGGMFGRGLARGGARALTGARDATTRFMTDRNIPLTLGQIAGRGGRPGQALRGVEDRLSGLPIVGTFIKDQQRRGFEAFDRAAFNEGLAPINANVGKLTGAPAVDAALTARSNAYSNALDPVTVNMDPQFRSDYRGAVLAGRGLPEPMRGNIGYTLPTRIENSFSPTGELTGRDFQQSIRGLRRDASAVESQPFGHDFGQITRQGEGALEGLLGRQAPDTLEAYRAANAANRNVEILRDATNRARNGSRSGAVDIFTPSQLSDATAANSRRFGNTQGTTQQPFFDLTRHAQSILPNTVPDSGSAGRWLLPAALIGGGEASDQTGLTDRAGEIGLALGGLSLPYTNRGQRLLQTALARRPEATRRLGEYILAHPEVTRRAGMFAAPVPSFYGIEDNY